MTRSFASAQKRRPRRTQPIRVMRSPRDPSITPYGFKCFRLVRIYDGDPGEPPFAAIELQHSTNAMFAFTKV